MLYFFSDSLKVMAVGRQEFCSFSIQLSGFCGVVWHDAMSIDMSMRCFFIAAFGDYSSSRNTGV